MCIYVRFLSIMLEHPASFAEQKGGVPHPRCPRFDTRQPGVAENPRHSRRGPRWAPPSSSWVPFSWPLRTRLMAGSKSTTSSTNRLCPLPGGPDVTGWLANNGGVETPPFKFGSGRNHDPNRLAHRGTQAHKHTGFFTQVQAARRRNTLRHVLSIYVWVIWGLQRGTGPTRSFYSSLLATTLSFFLP
jgi:hypothetical protein